MSDPGFKPGDIVTLRSGGPTMCVGYVYDGSMGEFGPSNQKAYDCFWFDDEKHLQRGSFAEETLSGHTMINPMVQQEMIERRLYGL